MASVSRRNRWARGPATGSPGGVRGIAPGTTHGEPVLCSIAVGTSHGFDNRGPRTPNARRARRQGRIVSPPPSNGAVQCSTSRSVSHLSSRIMSLRIVEGVVVQDLHADAVPKDGFLGDGDAGLVCHQVQCALLCGPLPPPGPNLCGQGTGDRVDINTGVSRSQACRKAGVECRPYYDVPMKQRYNLVWERWPRSEARQLLLASAFMHM